MVRIAATTVFLLSLAGAALAAPPPPPAADWVFPAPDPKAWWEDKWPKPTEAADPLGGRRLGRNERPLAVDNGFEPTLYRLWGLPPLQTQVLRGEEMILELAIRPTTSVRQTLIRVTVRRDGESFVQGRAGLGCCEPEIGRRVGFDAKLPPGSADRFLSLRNHPVWNAPRDVRVVESSGTSDALCVSGTSYELTLAVPGRSRSVRRACDSAEIGQAADVLEAVLGAGLGHEPRIDVIFPGGANFTSARDAYQDLIAEGGVLKASPHARAQPPAFEPPTADAVVLAPERPQPPPNR